MKLSVRERLVIQSILPKEGNFVTLKVLRKLQDSLGFSEDEIKKYKFEYKNDIVKWDDTIEQDKEVEIGEKAFDIISGSLKELDKQGKLHDEHYDIYVKFVENKDE